MTVLAPPPVEFARPEDPHDLVRASADQVRFLYVPYRRYLVIDGCEEPGGPAFQSAVGAVYPVAYTLHYLLRHRGVITPVGHLESLYWAGRPGPLPVELFDDGCEEPQMAWRLLLPVPDEATDEEVRTAIADVGRKPDAPMALSQLRCEGWLEGECAQILHIGPYDAEYPTVKRLHEAIAAAELRPRGCHHEIYLSPPDVEPERVKTVIRQPVEDAGW
jgi:hypothetical protein